MDQLLERSLSQQVVPKDPILGYLVIVRSSGTGFAGSAAHIVLSSENDIENTPCDYQVTLE